MAAEVGNSHILGDHEHNGKFYPNFVLPSSMDALQTFTVRPDDIWIVTYPKSGTHWVAEIASLIRTRGVPEKIDRSLMSATIEMIQLRGKTLPLTREEELKQPVDMAPHMDIIDRAPSPRLILSHSPLELLPPNLITTAKVIYVARNPKDAINSFFNFIAKTPREMPWDQLLSIHLAGKTYYGGWPNHVKSFWKVKDEANVLYCFYESMKRDPLKNVRQIADFLNTSLTDDELEKIVEHSSFSGMKKTYDKTAETGEDIGKGGGHFVFMNKGVVGAWKSRFTVAQNEMFDAWYREQMSDSDISFDYD